MSSPLESDLAFAHTLADAAERVALSYFKKEPREWNKADGSIATEADLAVEDELRRMVGEHRAGDAMLGEERGETGSGPRRWIVDGIDGTIEFAAGVPNWGTLIALEVDGEVVAGVCNQPVNRRRYWAMRGHGAFRSADGAAGAPLRLRAASSVRDARAYIPPDRWLPTDRARAFAAALRAATDPAPQSNHPAAQLLEGGYDIVPFQKAGPWDVAAFAVIVEEAGGRFSDLDGGRRIDTKSVLFTSGGAIHDEVLSLYRVQ